MQFFKKILLTFTLFTLTSHKCLVYSSGSSQGDAIAGSHYTSQQAAPAEGGPSTIQQQKAPATLHAQPSPPQPPHHHQQQQQQQQHNHQQQLHQQHHHQYSSHGIGGGGLTYHHPPQGAVINNQQHQPAVYHQPSHSGHAEHKNTYNLLSEAMSQAVSNEFSK